LAFPAQPTVLPCTLTPYCKLSIKGIALFIVLYNCFLIHLSIRHPALNIQLFNSCSKTLIALLVRNLFAVTKFKISKNPLENLMFE